MLVGNKCDREDEREVDWTEASRWASQHGMFAFITIACVVLTIRFIGVHIIETSSLTGENVEAPFLLAIRQILLSIESGELDPEKAGSGVSYGDRALRRVNSSSGLSFGSLSGRKKRSSLKLKMKDWVPGTGGRCC